MLANPLELATYIGIEIDEDIYNVCVNNFRNFEKERLITSKTFLIYGNILDYKDIYPVTHVYSFNVGMPPYIIFYIIGLCVYTSSVKVLCLFKKDKDTLNSIFYPIGLIDHIHNDDDFPKEYTLKMQSDSFMCYFIPLTVKRKELIKSRIGTVFDKINKTKKKNISSDIIKFN